MARREQELSQFIRDGLSKGIERNNLTAALVDVGWPAAQIEAALDGFPETRFSIPVPAPRPYMPAREAFLYLVLFSTLSLSAFYVGDLLFILIDEQYHHPNVTRAGWHEATVLSISFAVVAVPVFAVTASRIRKMMSEEPARIGSPVQQWMTFAALFIVAGVLIGDFVALTYQFLLDDRDVRILLKLIVVATISALVVGYLVTLLRKGR